MLRLLNQHKFDLYIVMYFSTMERGLTPELENTIRYFIDHQVQEAFLKFRQQDDQAVLQELRHQRELMQQMQQNMDKRFEAVDKRFEAVDKRFEQMQQNMDKRFEAIDKRFEENRYYMDKRFEDLMHHTDKRFEDMDKRFRLMQWTMVIGFSILSVMMTVFKFVA